MKRGTGSLGGRGGSFGNMRGNGVSATVGGMWDGRCCEGDPRGKR